MLWLFHQKVLLVVGVDEVCASVKRKSMGGYSG